MSSLTKISSSVIADGAITANKISAAVPLGGPKVSNVAIANSSYTILDDTAISLDGGYLVITGENFVTGCTVIIDNTPAISTTFVNSTTIRAEVDAKTAGTYNLYVVNADGGTAIRINGLTYSGTPTWVTSSTLSSQQVDVAFDLNFDATGATSYSNTSALPAGTTLLSNGYFYGTITGIEEETVYNFTVAAIDEENQDSPRTFSVTVSVAQPDALFHTNTLLLVDTGEDGGNNNIFVDSSNSPLSITVTGNVAQGSPTPYDPQGGCLVSYKSITDSENQFQILGPYDATNNDWAFSFGNESAFTLEMFVKIETNASIVGIPLISVGSNGTNLKLAVRDIENSKSVYLQIGGDNTLLEATGTSLFDKNWHHLAISRDSSFNWSMYIDGTRVDYLSDAIYTLGAVDAYVTFLDSSSGDYADVYLSNLRVIKGSAIYTGTSITVPTSKLTAVTNTKLILFQDTYLSNRATSLGYNLDLSFQGSVTGFIPGSPFLGGSENAPWDSSYGGSFRGGTGNIQVSNVPNMGPESGTSEYTIEFWIYLASAPSSGSYLLDFGSALGLYLNTNRSITWYRSDTATLTSPSLSLGRWNHVALVYGSDVSRFFINGMGQSSTSGSRFTDNTYTLTIKTPEGAFLSNIRISRSALYSYNSNGPDRWTNLTSNKLIPTTNTTLLLNFEGAKVYDATGKSIITTTSLSNSKTAQYKWQPTSIYSISDSPITISPLFPSSFMQTDSGGNSANYDKEMTIEFWYYTTNSNVDMLTGYDGGSVRFNLMSLEGSFAMVKNDSTYEYGPTIATNTWTHLIYSRKNGTAAWFVNGTRNGDSFGSSVGLSKVSKVLISSSGQCYIDDLRISSNCIYGTGTTVATAIPTKALSTY